MDEDTLRKWMALELKGTQDRLARRRVPLTELVAEDDPAVTTRGGDEHRFDRRELERWRDATPPHKRHRLRLPVFLVQPHGTSPRDVFVEDGDAAAALQEMGLLRPDAGLREGKLWMGRALAVDLHRELPTTTQLAIR